MDVSFDRALSEAQDSWMDIEGVTGVGQGMLDGKDCITVFVTAKTPEIEERIPRTYRGIPVEIRESGILYAAESPAASR